MMHPYFLGLLAVALAGGGKSREGLEVLAGGLAVIEETGERYFEAELYRLRGELLLKSRISSSGTEARDCFRTALTVARRQKSLSLELRAAISAARVARRSGCD